MISIYISRYNYSDLLHRHHDSDVIPRYKDGGELDLSDEGKFGGGAVENPSLFIRSASRRDVGRYRCEVANSVGVGTADNQAIVHVQCEYWSVIWGTELSDALAAVTWLLLHHDWWIGNLYNS